MITVPVMISLKLTMFNEIRPLGGEYDEMMNTRIMKKQYLPKMEQRREL